MVKIKSILLLLFIATGTISADTIKPGITSPAATNKDLSSQIIVIMADLAKKKKKLSADYTKAMQDIGWFTIMDFNKIKKPADIAKKQKIVNNAIAIIRNHKKKIKEFKAFSRKALENIKAPAEEKKSLLAGYDKGTKGEKAKKAKLYWNLEEGIALKVKALTSMLASNQSSWAVKKGNIEFNNQKYLNRYNNSIDAINKYVTKQTAIRNGPKK